MDMINNTKKMIRYNMRIIFANKFIYFFIAAFLLFLGITAMYLFNGQNINAEGIYNLLMFTGGLLVFYPFSFAIQGDKDARTLEIIFGIPNYRYRVWLMRIAMITLLVAVIQLFFAFLADIALYPVPLFGITINSIFPILFIGTFALYLSSVMKSGAGSAVVTIILVVIMLLMTQNDTIYESFWNIFFNPYGASSNMNEIVWAALTVKSRIFLSVGIILFLLGTLTNLQKRESFLK